MVHTDTYTWISQICQIYAGDSEPRPSSYDFIVDKVTLKEPNFFNYFFQIMEEKTEKRL